MPRVEIWDHHLKTKRFVMVGDEARMSYSSFEQPYKSDSVRDNYQGSRCQTCSGCGYCSSI